MNRNLRTCAAFVTAASFIGACSAATPERSSTASAAVDPVQVFEPTYYKVTLQPLGISRAQEPYQSGVQQGESCPPPLWTPDTGFVDVAQIGLKVNPTTSGTSPFNGGNPQTYPCTIDPQSGSCKAGAFGQSFTGPQLQINFYVNPGDSVAMGIALDNVEVANVNALTTQLSDTIGTGFKDFGDVAQVVGPSIAFGSAGTLSEVGAAVGILGAFATTLGDTINANDTQTCAANTEAQMATSCVGGLLGGPLGLGHYSNVDAYGNWTNYCIYNQAPPDTLRIVDPTTNQDFTADRLRQMTANGDATFEFNFAYDLSNTQDPNSQCAIASRGNLQYMNGLSWDSSQPMMMAGCASSIKMDVTISRQWNVGLGGPAAYARSSDMAVVRDFSGVIDTVNVEPNQPELIVHRHGSTSSFTPEYQGLAQAAQQTAVTLQTAPVVVSRSTDNLDTFWIDSKGGLYTAFTSKQPSSGSFGSTWNPWNVKNIVSPTHRTGRIGHVSIAPPNASMTATARTPNNLDVFFVGYDGNVWTSWWNSGSGVDSSGLPNWPVPVSTTTGTCDSTNTSCAGSGVPGGPIAAVARTPDSLDVFYVGKDGGVWWTNWSSAAGWHTREIYGPNSQRQPGNGVAAGATGIAATARTNQNLDVFFVDAQGTLWRSTWSENGDWGTAPVDGTAGKGLPGAPLSAVSRQPQTLDVVFPGPGQTLQWAYSSLPGPWAVSTIGVASGLGNTSPPGSVSLVAPTSFSLEAFYLNASHQLETVGWSDPSQCSALASNGCTSPGSFPWTGAWTPSTETQPQFGAFPPPACAKSVGVGPNGQAWVIGCSNVGAGGNGIYKLYYGYDWVQTSGAATRVAVSPEGTPWVVNAAGNIFEWNGSSFQASAPLCASQIGVGSNGQAWAIGCSPIGGGGNGVFRLQNGAWVQIPGAQATQIAVSPEGTPWVVNAYGSIFEWNGSTFVSAPNGCANRIAVGPNGQAWVLGCDNPAPGGHGVYYLQNGTWTQYPGVAATEIAVSPEGTPWLIDAFGTIWD